MVINYVYVGFTLHIRSRFIQNLLDFILKFNKIPTNSQSSQYLLNYRFNDNNMWIIEYTFKIGCVNQLLKK